MNDRTRAVIAVLIVIPVALALSGCNGFFVSPNSLANITVTPGSALLTPGTTQQLSVSAVLVNGNSSDVTSSATYTSPNQNVLTVDSNGLVTGVGGSGGTSVSVTVSYQGQTATVLFLVTTSPITSITVTPSVATLSITSATQVPLVARANDGTIISQFVTWTSSNSSAVNVTSAGVISPASTTTGTASVTASFTPTGGTAVTSNSVTVTVNS